MRKDTPRYTAKQAKSLGDCAVIAMSKVTGLSWDAVWEVAQHYFQRTGLSPADQYSILKELGYTADSFFKLIHWDRLRDPWCDLPNQMTVVQAEKWLQENMPDAKLICSIVVDGGGHAISFRNGKFHNTLGAKRARIKGASIISKAA